MKYEDLSWKQKDIFYEKLIKLNIPHITYYRSAVLVLLFNMLNGEPELTSILIAHNRRIGGKYEMMKILKGLKKHGLVDCENRGWNFYYWFITDAGKQFLNIECDDTTKSTENPQTGG